MAIRPALRDELLALPAEERHRLADELYESLVDEPRDAEWERAWAKELEQRVDDVANKRVELLDADEVHAELRRELRDPAR